MVDRAQTEFVSFAIAKEASYGVLPGSPVWSGIEPDSVGEFGNEYTRERRDQFNVDRLLRQQKLTGISAMTSWEGDATDDHLELLMPMLLLSNWQNEWPQIRLNTTTTNAGRISFSQVGTYVIAEGDIIHIPANLFTTGGSLEIKSGAYLVHDVSSSTVGITPLEWNKEGRVVKGSPLAFTTASTLAGVAAERTVNVIGWEFSGVNTSLNHNVITRTGINFSIISESQSIYIAMGSANTTTALNPLAGLARVVSASGTTINFERPGKTILGASVSSVSNDRVYVLASRWIKNVHADNDKWNVDSYAMAAKYVDVSGTGQTSGDSYETIYGLNLASLSIRFSQQARVRLSVDMMGQIKRTTETAPTNFATAKIPTSVNAIATSVDIGEARLINQEQNADLATLLSSVDLNFSNNLSGDYYIDKLGSRGPQIGKFDLSASVMAALASREMLQATENEDAGSFLLSAGTEEGWWVFDVPRLTLNTDRRQYDRNQTLKLEYAIDYFPHRTSDGNVAMAVSRFPWLPKTE